MTVVGVLDPAASFGSQPGGSGGTSGSLAVKHFGRLRSGGSPGNRGAAFANG